VNQSSEFSCHNP